MSQLLEFAHLLDDAARHRASAASASNADWEGMGSPLPARGGQFAG